MVDPGLLNGDGHTQVVCVCAHMYIVLFILTSNKNPCHFELNFPHLLGTHALLQEENRHGDSEVESRMNHAMSWGSTREQPVESNENGKVMAVSCLWDTD